MIETLVQEFKVNLHRDWHPHLCKYANRQTTVYLTSYPTFIPFSSNIQFVHTVESLILSVITEVLLEHKLDIKLSIIYGEGEIFLGLAYEGRATSISLHESKQIVIDEINAFVKYINITNKRIKG